MSSIVVECRNKTSENVIQNGDWTTTLNENILIEEGDQIIVKDSFIDTQQTSSSKILVEDDTTLFMDIGYYIINNDQSHFYDYGTTTAPTNRTLRPMVLCMEINGLTADDGLLTQYTLETLDKSSTSIAGNITFTWENDIDFHGDRQNEAIVYIPKLTTNDKFDVREIIGSIVKKSSGITAEKLSQFNLKVSKQTIKDVSGQDVELPHIQTIVIPLKAGNYDPDELTQIINKEVNANNLVQSDYFTQADSVLETAIQIQSKYRTSPPQPAGNLYNFTLSDLNDSSFLYEVAPMKNFGGTDIYFGGSVFEISYSQDTKDFTIDRLHTPYYDTNITIQYVNINNKITSVNKIGGNFLNNLYARNSKNENVDFWNSQLGFGSEVLVDFKYEVGFSSKLIPQTENFIDGVKITGQSSTLDGVVSKTTPLVVTPIPSASVPADLTIGLRGSDNPTNIQDKFGYYLIEVGSQFKNEFLTPENNYRSIQQIVNRYYELNSYTSAQNGQIIYQHQGDSMLLQSFKCRVLTSDKEVPNNIGDDNTLHIEVVKGSKQK